MEISKYLSSILEEICQKLFPGSAVEVKNLFGFCIWPYILGKDYEEIDDKQIALALYRRKLNKECSMEEHRAIAATKGALYGFLLLDEICIKYFPKAIVKIKTVGIGLWPIVTNIDGKEISYEEIALVLKEHLNKQECTYEEKRAIGVTEACIESLLAA